MLTTAKVVETAIVDTYRTTVSFEEKVNSFLDGLIAIRKEYNELNKKWRNVNELIETYISNCQSKDELTKLYLIIDGLINAGESLLTKLIEQNSKNVLPTILSDMEDNLDHIKELQSDTRIKISDLPELLSAEEKLIGLGF
jgi:hypothetical protein